MNKLLRFALALVLLTGCSKNSEPLPAPVLAPDPLIGHWRADIERTIIYTKDGAVSHNDFVVTPNYLDATEKALSFSDSSPTTITYFYTRRDEVLTVSGVTSNNTSVAARSLTATSFVYETTMVRLDGSKTVNTLPFYRYP